MDLASVKDRLARKFRGEWMDSIYPGLGFREQIDQQSCQPDRFTGKIGSGERIAGGR